MSTIETASTIGVGAGTYTDPLGLLENGFSDPTISDGVTRRPTPLRRNGLGVAGFALALGGVVLGSLALLGLPVAGLLGAIVAVIAIVLSAIGLKSGRSRRGLAIAGLVIALLALPLDAAATLAVLSHLDTATTSTSITTGTPGAASNMSAGSGVENAAMVTDPGGTDLYSRDQSFLQVLTDHGVFLDANQQVSAAELGHDVATYMSQGGTVDDATQILVNSGFSSYDANIIVGDAIGSYLSTS